MKFNLTCIYFDKGQIGTITREISRGAMLVILVISLAACNRPQQASSGAEGGARATGTPGTPTPSGTVGEAVLNLERHRLYDDPNGSDTQREVGAIPLVFSDTVEGDLVVEGTGRIEWTEIANFPTCGFTAKAEGTVSVRGLFSVTDCKFHLTITTKYSQPTTSNQSADCTYSISFSDTEFSSQIELDPSSGRYKETMTNGWWEVTTVKLSDLKSDVVKDCFIPDVIQMSTSTP